MDADDAWMTKKETEITNLVLQEAKKAVNYHIVDILYSRIDFYPTTRNFFVNFSICIMEYPGTTRYLPEQALVISAESSQDEVKKIIKGSFSLEKAKEIKKERKEKAEMECRMEKVKMKPVKITYTTVDGKEHTDIIDEAFYYRERKEK